MIVLLFGFVPWVTADSRDSDVASWWEDPTSYHDAEETSAGLSDPQRLPDPISTTSPHWELAHAEFPAGMASLSESQWQYSEGTLVAATEWKFGSPDRSYRPYETMLASDPVKKVPWYEKISIRGYAQLRYNRLGETNPDLQSAQGDRSIGDNNSFILRRARMVVSGDISDRVYIYIQPDFASGVTGPNPLHFLQIRDFYSDIFLDEAKEYRIRAGQSKIPYGFENLQSSQNRLPFDRDDALNSGLVNERDLGLMFYWAPAEIRERFRYLVQSGLKGSGDYGVVGFGAYNGQTANRPERNDRVHIVGRVTYPFKFDNGQYFEPGISWYHGRFVIDRSNGVGGGDEFTDERVAWSFTYYPQPFGVQGEYTVGIGPELNKARTTVLDQSLHGGYIQFFYRYVDPVRGVFIPFTRFQYYRGGRKHEVNSPSQSVDEAEIGLEWEPYRELELTAMYSFANRTSPVFPYPQQSGSLLRLQLQWNY